MWNEISIETEIRNGFYLPKEKTVKGYQERVNKRWNEKGASVKRAFTNYSVLLATGFITMHCIYS